MQYSANYIEDAGNTWSWKSNQQSSPFPANIISPTNQADLQD